MTTNASRYLTPLMRAAAIGHLDSVVDILEEGVDVNQRGPRDSTALMFAAGGGHLQIVKELVERGADLEAREAGGWTALCHAEADNDEEIIEFLKNVGSMPLEKRLGVRMLMRTDHNPS